MRTSKDEWRRRVQRWKDSGLTAEAYAAEAGLKAKTLAWYKSALEREARGVTARPKVEVAKRPAKATSKLRLVELRPQVMAAVTIELELAGTRRLRFPETISTTQLMRIVAALEGRS